jgi:DNA polymerase/3'-5' exonuclease PolX
VSQGEPVAYGEALRRALALTGALDSACERLEIAGSLRRAKPTVRDIELVALPRFEDRAGEDLWSTDATHDLLEERIAELLAARFLEARQVANHRADGRVETQTKLGPAFKALVYRGIPVDLFIVRGSASWGCIYALRTGPGDWNTKLVTDCQAIGRRVAGGQAERWAGDGWVAVPTPEETDFFAALGQPWVDPEDRTVGRIRISRAIADGVPA